MAILLMRSQQLCLVKNLMAKSRFISTKIISGNFIDLGHQKIRFEMKGSGKEILFLMPGALGSTTIHCSPLLDNLNEEKYTTVCWDPPGNGYSDPYVESPRSDLFIRDAQMAAQLLKELGFSNVNVVGWCAGGHTALRLAANHPQLVKKLVLIGSWIKLDEKLLQMWNKYRDVTTFESDFRESVVKLYGFNGAQSRWNDFLDLSARVLDAGLDTFDASKDCRKIQCPSMITHSRDDTMSDYESQAKETAALIPNSRLITLTGAGHFIHFTRTKEFIKLLEDFISE